MSAPMSNRDPSYTDQLISFLKKEGEHEAVKLVEKFKSKWVQERRGVLSFGKYKGKNIIDVEAFDPSYMKFLTEKSDQKVREKTMKIYKEALQLRNERVEKEKVLVECPPLSRSVSMSGPSVSDELVDESD